MKKFCMLAIMLFVGVFLLSACDAIANAPEPEPTPEPTPAPTYNIGEILHLPNWEFTATETVGFAERIESGGTVRFVYEPTREDRIFAYVPVEITNISGERRQMLPARLQTQTQLTARLRYVGADSNTAFLPMSLSVSVGDVIDRPVNPGYTIDGKIFFQIPPEIENSTGNVELEIRTNAGDTMGVFLIR